MRLTICSSTLRLAASLALILALPRTSAAQDAAMGRLEGRVMDSTRARPLVRARVVAVSTDARATAGGSATTDSSGRYRIDALPPGRYAVGIESPLLDSLEMNLSPREVVVAPGRTATIDLALPPAEKLRAAMCPGVTMQAHTGVIFGHVVDAESENPLANAALAVSWQERDVDRKTLRPVTGQRTASAITDAGGWYRLCGVPTDTWLSLQLQHDERVGPVLRAIVGDTLGIAVRHLSFNPASAALAEDTVASAVGSAATAFLSGTAVLSGTIRGLGDQPLASADVGVRGTDARTRTDAAGAYTLRGLPAGTQVLDVRHFGYDPTEISVELRSGATATRDVRMTRIVNLDSIRVVATRSRYKEFSEQASKRMFGIFISPEQVEWRSRVAWVSSMIEQIPGFRVLGEAHQAKVISSRGVGSSGLCSPNIVVNDMEGWEINDLSPIEIGAIAAYRVGEPVPGFFDRGCGAILIWTKR